MIQIDASITISNESITINNETIYPPSGIDAKARFNNYSFVYLKGIYQTKSISLNAALESQEVTVEEDGLYEIMHLAVPDVVDGEDYDKNDSFYHNGELWVTLEDNSNVNLADIDTDSNFKIIEESELNETYYKVINVVFIGKSRTCLCSMVKENNKSIIDGIFSIKDKDNLKDVYKALFIEEAISQYDDTFTDENKNLIYPLVNELKQITCCKDACKC